MIGRLGNKTLCVVCIKTRREVEFLKKSLKTRRIWSKTSKEINISKLKEWQWLKCLSCTIIFYSYFFFFLFVIMNRCLSIRLYGCVYLMCVCIYIYIYICVRVHLYACLFEICVCIWKINKCLRVHVYELWLRNLMCVYVWACMWMKRIIRCVHEYACVCEKLNECVCGWEK